MMKRSLFSFAVAALCVGTTWAAPINKKDLAAEPALLVHVDVDALRSTAVGKTILADPDVQTKLAAVQAMFNFDFRSQLHGFSIYSAMEHSQDPVLILYADFEASRLITLAKAFPGFHQDTNDAHVIYTWLDEKKKNTDTPRIYASIAGSRLVFGKTEEALTSALNVIDGKGAGFNGGKLLLNSESGELVVAQGAVLKFDMDENNPSAAIFKASKAIRFKLGEVGDNVAATVSFEAKDADSAQQVSAMVNGLLAVVKFQKLDPAILKLANGINVRQDGATVILNLAAPSADIVALLKKGAAEHERKEQEQAPADTNAPAAKSP
ncbi:MAG TPA: hypothetical protein VHB20_00125 [Verrucomicrobiae bacterium]|jgi:hypothetical protein|nr:hypothetical protein [Verrucomicrobiae bacterium]